MTACGGFLYLLLHPVLLACGTSKGPAELSPVVVGALETPTPTTVMHMLRNVFIRTSRHQGHDFLTQRFVKSALD